VKRVLLLLALLPSLAWAGDFWSVQNGNWATNATWVGGVAPATGGTNTVNITNTVANTTGGQYSNLVILGTSGVLSQTVNLSAYSCVVSNGGKIVGSANELIVTSIGEPYIVDSASTTTAIRVVF
jgi:hypothetical protein